MSDVSASRTGERGTQPEATGKVVLVGAGPGDPDLLTVKAARLIGEAEVIFADRLVGKGILELANPEARIVPVGKSKGEHSVPQDEIHARMIAAAQAGKRVVRLKGGDPFIFGRGGEEVEALRAAGVAVEVVPGISAALGVAASAQIPLTHRDAAQAVTFVTGHAKLGQEPDLDWNALARANQTVVVYMGVGTAGTIAARLVAAGREPSTPVAVIENGTRDNEIRAFGTLGQVSEIIQRAGIQGPALLIIGEVVAVANPAPLLPSAARPASSPTSVGETKPSLADLWRLFS
jgi:uroporphyrin-III C-methyltransferase/precorrin-2 dehydrogenase/sirohydrochlorin ferrochelatase